MVKKRGKQSPQLFDPFPRTPEGHLAGRSGADQVPIFFGAYGGYVMLYLHLIANRL